MLPEAAPSGHNADVNTGASGSVAATSPVCKEEAEMRAALQFLMRHMVKRAVMRSPIKRALALADLERAQAMIYKLVVNGLTEEPSGGKTKPGELVVLGSTSLIMITTVDACFYVNVPPLHYLGPAPSEKALKVDQIWHIFLKKVFISFSVCQE